MSCNNCFLNDNLKFKCHTCNKEFCRRCISLSKHSCSEFQSIELAEFCNYKDCLERDNLKFCKICKDKYCIKHKKHGCIGCFCFTFSKSK